MATKLNTEFLVQAYREMSLIRAFEKKVWDLSAETPPKIIGSVHLCAGQEAIPVGVCAVLEKNRDSIVTTYRGHGWALAWGLDPAKLFAEICHRKMGLNGGRAGSALMMDPPSGFMGENSIVAAGAPIAAGVALAQQYKKTGGVVVITVGDGAMNQGALHEAIVFAVARRLPVIFVCENNGWSEMTRTDTIVPVGRLSRRGGGYGLSSATINGNDPLAVRDSFAVAVEQARKGEGPSFIECKTARLWGHYNRDVEHYRSKEDRRAAEEADPLPALKIVLSNTGMSNSDVDRLAVEAQERIEAIAVQALGAEPPDPATALHHIYVSGSTASLETRTPEVTPEVTYQQAVNEALRRELANRPEVVVFGEDVGHAGGIFGCTRNLQRDFGEHRVFDTPIAESAILGAAVGSAMSGLRPVVEIMWADFSLVALDQLFNQAANVSYITQGGTAVPMVVRMQQGATPGSCAQHSQSLEALMAHIPGLRVGLPATPQDAYSMLRAAVADPNPVIIIEARGYYQTKGSVDFGRIDTKIGGCRLVRPGSACTVITYGTACGLSEVAVDELRKEGHEVRLVDLRWLNPIDWAEINAHVAATGGLALVVHEANLTGGFGAEIAARLWEFGAKKVSRLASKDSRIPAAPILQKAILPTVADIRSAVLKLIGR
jgi:2-oxoisovalerate dehydrogenase E1 component